MASKLNFRARTLDASKPMAVYFLEDLPELADLNAINRSVPAMPSGMEKEEEAEKHLQDILEIQEQTYTASTASLKSPTSASTSSSAAVAVAHSSAANSSVANSSGAVDPAAFNRGAQELVIPTPEVYVNSDFDEIYRNLYKGHYKPPRQYIHMQPFSIDQDLPDYDLDEEDQAFFDNVLVEEKKLEVSEITFEDMLDRLEKNSGYSVVSLKEAKLLLKEDDELIVAVYDYWVDKRLRLKQPLMPTVKTDKRDALAGGGMASANTAAATSSSAATNPYIAFRRRTEKMQTRKNRKNDEASYEKMLKLRRDLSRAVTLLEMVKRREKTKKESLNLAVDIFEKRYHVGDWDGKIFSELQVARVAPPVLRAQQFNINKYAENWIQQQLQQQQRSQQQGGALNKRQHKKKKSKSSSSRSANVLARSNGPEFGTLQSSDEEGDQGMSTAASPSDAEEDDPSEGPYAFKRKRNCQYLAPLVDQYGFELPHAWPWESPEVGDGGSGGDPRYCYSQASLLTTRPRCLGMIRRRVGRGGRVVLDRAFAISDAFWRSMDFTVFNGCG